MNLDDASDRRRYVIEFNIESGWKIRKIIEETLATIRVGPDGKILFR